MKQFEFVDFGLVCILHIFWSNPANIKGFIPNKQYKGSGPASADPCQDKCEPKCMKCGEPCHDKWNKEKCDKCVTETDCKDCFKCHKALGNVGPAPELIQQAPEDASAPAAAPFAEEDASAPAAAPFAEEDDASAPAAGLAALTQQWGASGPAAASASIARGIVMEP